MLFLIQSFVIVFMGLALVLKSTASVTIEVPTTDIEMLQIYHTTFYEWVDDWFNTVNRTNKTSPLKERLKSYDFWIKTWLDSHSGSQPISSTSASSLRLPTTITTRATSLITPSRSVSSAVNTSITQHLSRFPSPDQSIKIVVYYGQQNTDKISLSQICQNPHVDIVILAFLTHFFGPGDFPIINFGAACGGQTSQMEKFWRYRTLELQVYGGGYWEVSSPWQ